MVSTDLVLHCGTEGFVQTYYHVGVLIILLMWKSRLALQACARLECRWLGLRYLGNLVVSEV